ncbi:MAG: hypothetical protein QOH48_2114 [Actinomycetota bacterium]|nr:hypothetical protein [Actinomycetota bacterium]
MNVEAYVASSLPQPRSRVLEVGAGGGELARALAARDHTVTAIDPQAPDESIVHKVSLEAFTDPGPFDAVVAITSLHHIHDLEACLEKIHRLLRPDGLLILLEFGWELIDEKTAEWCVSQGMLGPDHHAASSASDFLQTWNAEHAGLHDSEMMRQALDRFFVLKVLEWVPFIAEHVERPDLMEAERELMCSGAITPVGFYYVGVRTP